MDAFGIAQNLVRELAPLRFAAPTTHVYNPLEYALEPHKKYLRQYGRGRREVLLLGMNPGPFGMAQTGVPFGDVGLVRDWLGIEARVQKPKGEHPKKPIWGFDCPRREVSGQRLWGWARDCFRTPERFFARFFVANYCPLIFLEASGRNRTPDKLRTTEREPLLEICDKALRALVDYHQPKWVIGVGNFAAGRAEKALQNIDLRVGKLLHPSPASPLANRGWAEQATQQLQRLGVLQ